MIENKATPVLFVAAENVAALSFTSNNSFPSTISTLTKLDLEISKMSTQTLAAKVGVISDLPLVKEATTLASHIFNYAKGLVGMEVLALTGTTDVAPHPTLFGLINESRDLSAHLLASTRSLARSVISGSADKVVEVVEESDLKKESIEDVKSVITSVREAYSDVVDHTLETLERIIATSAHKTKAYVPKSDYTITVRRIVFGAYAGLKNDLDALKPEASPVGAHNGGQVKANENGDQHQS